MTMLTYTEISFPGLGISLNPSTGITLGSFSIRWYGLVIALGLCLAGEDPLDSPESWHDLILGL